jgi:hypothetical protein
MKTLKNYIGIIGLCFTLFVSSNLFSQEKTNSKKLFVRVYNLEGKKIGKGHIHFLNDTLLELKKNRKLIQFNVNSIGTIKTKRSAGHNILVGAAIGATTFAILGAASADPDAWIFGYTAAEGAAAGALGGALSGAALGGASVAFKKSLTYPIDGNTDKWRIFIEDFSGRKFD